MTYRRRVLFPVAVMAVVAGLHGTAMAVSDADLARWDAWKKDAAEAARFDPLIKLVDDYVHTKKGWKAGEYLIVQEYDPAKLQDLKDSEGQYLIHSRKDLDTGHSLDGGLSFWVVVDETKKQVVREVPRKEVPRK